MRTSYKDNVLKEQIKKLNEKLERLEYRLSKLENTTSNTIDDPNIGLYKSKINLFLATIFNIKMKLDMSIDLNLYVSLNNFSSKDNENIFRCTGVYYNTWYLFANYFKLHLNDYNTKSIDQETFDKIPEYFDKLQYDIDCNEELSCLCNDIKYCYLSSHKREKKILWTYANFYTDDPTEMKLYTYKKYLRYYLHYIYDNCTEEYKENRPLYYQYNKSLQIFISTRITCNNWIILFDLCNVADYSDTAPIKDNETIKEYFKYLKQFMNNDEKFAVDDFITIYLS